VKTAASKKSTSTPKPPPPINPKLAKYRRVLVLSGAAGSAKTAALDVLCREMDVQVVEWREGMKDEFGGDGEGAFSALLSSALSFANRLGANLGSRLRITILVQRLTSLLPARESLVHRFSSFLARAGMTPALDFGDFEDATDSPSSSSSFSKASSSSTNKSSFDSLPANNRRLILLEDLPNVSHFPTKLALRSAIAQYLASPRVTCPLVVVISEALARPGTDDGGGIALSGGGGRGDSYDARSVLGIEILQNPACREIQCG
jgi:cell cycle checkpoint protein